MSQQGLYVPKKAYLGAKMAVFGPNILIILGGSKSSDTHISENHLGTLFALLFGQAWHQMDQKGQYLAQNDQKCIFLAKFGRFWGIVLMFWRGSKSFGTHTSENKLGTSLPLVGHSTTTDQKGKYLAKNANFQHTQGHPK